MSSVPSSKSVLIILGMHRSGTSALAGLCERLGIPMGETLLPPTPENPRGYFEDVECIELHDKIFTHFGVAWDSLHQLPGGWQLSPAIIPMKKQLAEIIQRRSEQPIWGIKDPRLCRLLPLWLSVLEELKIKPHFLLSVRSPYEVANSLADRDGIRLHTSLMLWMIHNLEAEYYTRSYNRFIVHYPHSIHNWNDISSILKQELKLDTPHLNQERQKDIDDFLSSDLYRQRSPKHQTPLQQGFPMINELWSLLKKPDLGREEYLTLNRYWHESRFWLFAFTDWIEYAQGRIFKDFDGAIPDMTSVLNAFEEKQQKITSLQNKIDYLQSNEGILHEKIRRMELSNSWRLTAPLRAIKTGVRKLLW